MRSLDHSVPKSVSASSPAEQVLTMVKDGKDPREAASVVAREQHDFLPVGTGANDLLAAAAAIVRSRH